MEQVLSRVTTLWSVTTGWPVANVTARLWLALWAERRALDRLDARMLHDIGLSESEARQEAGRPMWDVPRARQPNAF